jgi:hypothetical protein
VTTITAAGTQSGLALFPGARALWASCSTNQLCFFGAPAPSSATASTAATLSGFTTTPTSARGVALVGSVFAPSATLLLCDDGGAVGGLYVGSIAAPASTTVLFGARASTAGCTGVGARFEGQAAVPGGVVA